MWESCVEILVGFLSSYPKGTLCEIQIPGRGLVWGLCTTLILLWLISEIHNMMTNKSSFPYKVSMVLMDNITLSNKNWWMSRTRGLGAHSEGCSNSSSQWAHVTTAAACIWGTWAEEVQPILPLLPLLLPPQQPLYEDISTLFPLPPSLTPNMPLRVPNF